MDLISFNDDIPYWVSNTQVRGVPKNAVKCGFEGDLKLFIGRAEHCGSLTPGKVVEHHEACVIPWGTISNEKRVFEYLISENGANWVAAENGNVPENAFCGGIHSEDGESLYIGRVKHEGAVIVGKIQPSHGVCYIAYLDKELNFKKYEVLVI